LKTAFKNRSLISSLDLSKEEILYLLAKAKELKKTPIKDLLKGSLLASCFFEPSTRTRLSFETAMLQLGGKVMGFSEPGNTSSKKGESLSDSMKIIGQYADIIVLRHPLEGAARAASEATNTPVINAGDGSNQHPTQMLLDLFSIEETQKTLDGVKMAICGDLKYGRTVHSLALAAALFDMRLYFISPDALTLPDHFCNELRKKAVRFSFHRSLEEILDKVDILYMTRIQKERFEEGEFDKIKGLYVLKESMLGSVKPNFKVLHPLPRLNEIDPSVDNTPYAYYFQQAENGIYVRQALLALLLNKSF
jgi:aspartate carbamoyltransferase catalytic subunit